MSTATVSAPLAALRAYNAMHAPESILAHYWDEPAGALTPRGWLHRGAVVAGFYLDYGSDNYRSPHRYCQPDKPCPDCQPGNVLAVRYPDGPGTPAESRYCETVADAKQYVEAAAAVNA